MSHWFHRSFLKATTVVHFDGVFSKGLSVSKLGSDLKKARDRVLELLPDPSQSIDTLNTAYIAYLSLMSGFLTDHKIAEKKVRYAVQYKWTHTLLGQSPQAESDAAFDIANMSVNVALWHMKHAAFVASKDSVSMDDAKEIHISMRKAAGILQMLQRDIIPILEKVTLAGSDLDQRVMSAYLNQCTAEAQEVTVARAIEMKHNHSLISALANETSKLFNAAAKHLVSLDKPLVEQWTLYLNIKEHIYLAYAYCYCGQNLLDQDHCGEAIRALKESDKSYKRALQLCKLYSKIKGPARPVKPDGHVFFTKINSTVTLILEKCERENGFIYHQKVPEDPPELETKATYGLASPEEYHMPPPAPLWEAAFQNESELPTVGQEPPARNRSGLPELPKVVEVEQESASEKPKNDHGCVLQ